MKSLTFALLLISTICYSQNISIIVADKQPLISKHIELRIPVHDNSNSISTYGMTDLLDTEEIISYCKENGVKHELQNDKKRLVLKEINQAVYQDMKTIFGKSFKKLKPHNIEPKNEKEIQIKLYKSLIEEAKEEATLVCQSLDKTKVGVIEVKVLEKYKSTVGRYSELSNFEWQTLFTKLEVVFQIVQ